MENRTCKNCDLTLQKRELEFDRAGWKIVKTPVHIRGKVINAGDHLCPRCERLTTNANAKVIPPQTQRPETEETTEEIKSPEFAPPQGFVNYPERITNSAGESFDPQPANSPERVAEAYNNQPSFDAPPSDPPTTEPATPPAE